VPAATSIARRASFILAVVGFAVFWFAAMLAAANLSKGPDNNHAEMAAGFGVFLAILAHLVGIGLAFAAPRGRRMVPALLNFSSLGLIAAVMAVGLALRH
jgi:hypothetical protein